MKNSIKYIIACFLCMFAFSCNNDFLMEETDVTTTAVTEILILPEKGADDYSFYVPTAGNSKFSIIKTPDWLQVNTLSGQFVNDVATINCSASIRSDFSEIGIHKDLLLLDIEGKWKCLVPVFYVSEGNPVIETEKSITVSYYTFHWGYFEDIPLVIKNSGQGILLWSIAEMPEGFSIDELKDSPYQLINPVFVVSPNEEIVLHLKYNSKFIDMNNSNGKMVVVSNDKNNTEIVIDIHFYFGNPSLEYLSNELNFGQTKATQSLQLYIEGGLLLWKIESCPEWLNISSTNGILSSTSISWADLIFTCDRSLLPEGQHTQTIFIKTSNKNNPLYAITISVVSYSANQDNIKAINGTVTDAQMNKNTDILYLTTSQPNRLLAYNTKTKTIDKELNLSKAPTCFSISEDGHKAVIGHDKMISSVDMDHFSITKTFEVDFTIFDIEWGSGNWCCYTQGEEVQHYILQWMNLDTEETNDTPYSFSPLYSKTHIKKIPHQDYIVASRKMISPSGIDVFDINNRSEIQFFYQNIGNFWFSSDGKYLFSGLSIWDSQIYSTASLINESPYLLITPISSFSPNPYEIFWIDHSEASHSVWILSSFDYNFDEEREILKYKDSDYTHIKTYYYDSFYNGNPAQAHYVFANNAGNELIAIKNIVSENNYLNDWSLEHIAVTK